MAGYEYKNEIFETNELKVNSIIDKISTIANNNSEPNIASREIYYQELLLISKNYL
jgi:hypothetical protein